MSYTKRDFINGAFEEIGIASYTYDLNAGQIESALRRLDAMMALWAGDGINLGYPLPDSPKDSDPDEDSNVPDFANQAIIENLALIMAPQFGKVVSRETKVAAKKSYDLVKSRTVSVPTMCFPNTLARGAGYKVHQLNRNTFFKESYNGCDSGSDC